MYIRLFTRFVFSFFLVDVAEQVFNRCMLDNKLNVENVNYQITFNYEFLDDLYSVLNWAEKGSSDSGSSSGKYYCLFVLSFTAQSTLIRSCWAGELTFSHCFLAGFNLLGRPGNLAQSGASLTTNQGVVGSSPGLATFFSMTILTLPLIQEGQLSVTGKRMGT